MNWKRFFTPRPGTISGHFVHQFREQFCYLQDFQADLSVLPATYPKGDVRFRPNIKAKIILFVSPLMAALFIFAAYANSGSIIAWSGATCMVLISPMFAYSFIANTLRCRSLTFNKHDLHVREYDGTEWRASYRSYLGVRQSNLTRYGPKLERYRAITLVHNQRERNIRLYMRHKADNEPSPLADYVRILDVPIIEAKAQPTAEQQEGWRSWILPEAIALVIFLAPQGGLILWASFQHKAHFVVQNHTQSKIARGEIATGNRSHSIRPIAVGKQRTVAFPAADEGEFSVVIELANGRKLIVDLAGHLTPGEDTQVTLDVHDDRIIATEAYD